MLILGLLCVVAMLVVYGIVKPPFRATGPFLPDSLVAGIAIYFLGAVYVDQIEAMPHANSVLTISLVSLLSALAGGIFFSVAFRHRYANCDFERLFVGSPFGRLERLMVFFLIAFSVLVCSLFIYAVLSDSLIGALLSVASIASDSSFLEARKAITSGSENYFAPGYVKQFRDILIPLLVIALVCARPLAKMSFFAISALAASLIAMIISGQRLVFVVLFLSLMLGGHFVRQYRGRVGGAENRYSAARVVAALLVLAGVYAALTVLLGRSSTDLGVIGAAGEIFANLLERIFVLPPHENALTYPVWSTLGPTYGSSWLSDLAAILPGVTESFSNILHSASGGSLQGNSPLGLPADVWFAWGWVGCITLPFLYVVGIGFLDMVLSTENSPVFFGLRCYLFVALPICYSPYLFILYGGAVAFVLIVAVKVLRSKIPHNCTVEMT